MQKNLHAFLWFFTTRPRCFCLPKLPKNQRTGAVERIIRRAVGAFIAGALSCRIGLF
ncbi:MAG TPA: hypothetical protein PLD48_05515 [Bacillota bacterium]|nr:hypothetical protein [Bacillota bacterium]HOK69453.1 hypothetical protein [Bacillota bacterium]HPP84956.1 hypothetical protein [Bacillota bacterium]